MFLFSVACPNTIFRFYKTKCLREKGICGLQMYTVLISKQKDKHTAACLKLSNVKYSAASHTHTDVDTIFIKPSTVVEFILINLHNNCAFFHRGCQFTQETLN